MKKLLECHNSKQYQAGWAIAKDTLSKGCRMSVKRVSSRHMQIVEGFSTE